MTTKEKFLLPEVRCDYQVDAKMKAIWKIELDMLEEFMMLCDRHKLRWFLIAGSLLGAIRHKGFIPWDDDIDIGMMRDDYMRFLAIASKELKYPLWLQSTYTERAWPYEFAKIHNSETTAIDTVLAKQGRDVNSGIFIDIFPIDGINADYALHAKVMRRAASLSQWRYYTGDFGLQPKKIIKWIVGSVCKVLPLNKWLSDKRISQYSMWPVEESEKCGMITFAPGNSRFEWDTSFFKDEDVEVPFEYLKVRVPRQYEKILNHMYGNWHVFQRSTSFHDGTTCFDPYRPYKKVRKELFGF